MVSMIRIFCPTKVKVNEATIDEVIDYGCFMKKTDVEITQAIDLYKALRDYVYYRPEEQPTEPQQQDQWLPTRYEPDAYYNTVHSSAPRQIDCFTIALDKKTGTTFPVDIKNQNAHALYDTGACCTLINYSMCETLRIDPDKGYTLEVKSSSGENMGALGQVPVQSKLMAHNSLKLL